MPYTDVDMFQTDIMPGSSDAVFPRIVAQAAMIASAYIDSRLQLRYAIPLTAPYPDAIVAISNLLTRCVVTDLQQKRAPFTKRGGQHNYYEWPDKWLGLIVSGDALLTDIEPYPMTHEWGETV